MGDRCIGVDIYGYFFCCLLAQDALASLARLELLGAITDPVADRLRLLFVWEKKKPCRNRPQSVNFCKYRFTRRVLESSRRDGF